MSTIENVMQLIGLIIIFVIILVATYYTTKWIGKTGLGQGKNRNISVIETYKLTQNKFIQIVKVGEKYIAIGISKDHIEYLTDVDKDQLLIQEMSGSVNNEFKDVFSKLITKQNHKDKE